MQTSNSFQINKQSNKCKIIQNFTQMKKLLINQAPRSTIRDYILVDKNQEAKNLQNDNEGFAIFENQ
jgi:hypothetical protein